MELTNVLSMELLLVAMGITIGIMYVTNETKIILRKNL